MPSLRFTSTQCGVTDMAIKTPNTLSVDENRSEANRWLEKAVQYETEGKAKSAEMAFKKSLSHENAIFA